MSKLSVGIRLHDMEPASLERRLEMAHEQGFTCVHLASKVVYAEYGIDRFGLTPGLAAHLRRELDRNHLDCAVFGCYKNLATPFSSQLDNVLAEYESCARFAAWMGCGIVGTETGRPSAGNEVNPDRFGDKALATLEAGLTRAVGACERFGVTLAIEPGYNEVVCTPERCRAVLDAVASPSLGVIYDPVALLHAAILPQAQDEVGRMLDLCGREIQVLHAKDCEVVPADAPDMAGAVDDAGRLVCHGAGTTGCFDLAPIVAWADRTKPHLQAVVENSTPETAVASREYLERL
jgi:sugar phosphate isomerase/epimerase